MIERVYQQAKKAAIQSIYVATDDTRIQRVVEGFGGQVILTREDHLSGTDRLAEVCTLQGWPDDDIVINLQGDEPLMPPEVIRFIADLAANTDAEISTLATPIHQIEDLMNPNIVKVVLDADYKAHYFSRAPIPWDRDHFHWFSVGETPAPDFSSGQHYRHLGMYAYRVCTLKLIPTLPPCGLERVESLEQLRPLYHGINIQVGIIENAPDHGIDTEEDLLRVNALFSDTS